MEVTKWLKPSISVSRIGDSASVQAATRVNAEQASHDIDAVAEDVVLLDDHVAEVDTDAEAHLPLLARFEPRARQSDYAGSGAEPLVPVPHAYLACAYALKGQS